MCLLGNTAREEINRVLYGKSLPSSAPHTLQTSRRKGKKIHQNNTGAGICIIRYSVQVLMAQQQGERNARAVARLCVLPRDAFVWSPFCLPAGRRDFGATRDLPVLWLCQCFILFYFLSPLFTCRKWAISVWWIYSFLLPFAPLHTVGIFFAPKRRILSAPRGL